MTTSDMAEAGFSLVEHDNEFSLADSCGGGAWIRKPVAREQLRERIIQFVTENADVVADELLDGLYGEEDEG